MLGRQQIAGIPTAISELFRNAHDAYADRVEVDFYRSDRMLVLRDDGLGMTGSDFEGRWLTIGTESKLSKHSRLGPPTIDPTKPERPVLGEKGIGRLAIAALGPQVLILTRAVRQGELQDLVAGFVHWGLFELPGVDLDQISIPIRTYPTGELPTQGDIDSMAEEVERNLDLLAQEVPGIAPEALQAIRHDLTTFRSIDPTEIDSYVPHLSLAASHGTHFVILPTDEVLLADVRSQDSSTASSKLEKLLLGFSNSITPGHRPPMIRTAFRYHEFDEAHEDLIQEGKFFTPKTFEIADHCISGKFDEFGQFQGEISIYQEAPVEYIVPWPAAGGKESKCGPFEFHMALLQGAGRHSRLTPEIYAGLAAKMSRYGGLYIYRNGIRMLPYGDADFDWLEIEKRRSMKADYYYFSHRNMFGAILLTDPENRALKEKAGREGFIENFAYRQLRNILQNFLVQVAGDFFRRDGALADLYQETRQRLQKQNQVLKTRQKDAQAKRTALQQKLDAFFAATKDEQPKADAMALYQQVEAWLLEADQKQSDPKDVAEALLLIEKRARSGLFELEQTYKVAKPRGVALPKKLAHDYLFYESAYQDLQKSVFHGVRHLIETRVGEAADQARLELDRRLRIEASIEDLATEATKITRNENRETSQALEKLERNIRDSTRAKRSEVDATVKKVQVDLARTDVQNLEDGELLEFREDLEQRILGVQQQTTGFLQYLKAQLEAIDLTGEHGQLDQLEALEQRNLELEERAEHDLQLAQLGMAVDVINHEFDSSIRSIRLSLKRLNAWADVNEDLAGLYQNLRTSFDHLDGFLTLFTPLHRRLNRKRVKFTGMELQDYLADLFGPRFERHNVTLTSTPEFRKWSVTAYPSSFYPVMVNLLDNAVFWLSRVTRERKIELHADGKSVLISNTGESIPERRRDMIFEQGVSFKPGGRGLGLHISRETLRRIDYDLELAPTRPGFEVTFQIKPMERDE